MNKHPDPKKDAPLWCKIQQRDANEPLGYRYIREKILKKNMERAEVDKPSNPHHYRYSRASYLANEMTEAQLCAWFGWVHGSNVPARYVHLSGLDNAYDALHGLYEPDEDDEEASIVECPRCEELNEPSAAFCMRCGQALDIDAVKEVVIAEDATAESAEDENLRLALQVVKAMRADRDEVEAFVSSLDT